MKLVLIFPFLAIALLSMQEARAPASNTSAQATPLTSAQQEAVDELKEAARSYREGNFVEAQQHSEKALVLDPQNKPAPLFIARTLHAQYRPGDRVETNIAKAREAIDAYRRILTGDPENEEAYKAVAYLYHALKEDELHRQWVLQRALDAAVSAEKRAEAFVVLASRDWDCSFKITELPANKITTLTDRSAKVEYIKPKDLAEFAKAQQCAANGLALIESALTLNPVDESAWSYKTNLLLELSRLAEMDNNFPLKAEYEKQSEAALSTALELSKKRESNATTKP